MKFNYLISSVFVVALILSGSSVAFAEEQNQGGAGGPGSRPPMAPHMVGARGPSGMGSTTWNHGEHSGNMMASSTWSTDGRPGMGRGSTTDMTRVPNFHGIPGVVTEVDADHFLMASRGLGRGTTTLTIVVGADTLYFLGSSTASQTDVTVGSKVEVLGKMATSTKTITAKRVRIGNGEGRGSRMMEQDHQGSSTEDVRQGGGHPDFLTKFKNFFGIGGGQGNNGQQASGGPAAVGAQDDFFGGFMHSMFGWLR